MEKRPMCTKCNKHVCAINYVKNNKRYYRSVCSGCNRKSVRSRPRTYLWQKSGYKKKQVCDLCGFRSLYTTQITVYHIDGDLTNTNMHNLRSVCLNCVEVVKRKEINWKRGDLEVDNTR